MKLIESYKNLSSNLQLLAQWCLVVTAFFIPISIFFTDLLMSFAVLMSIASGVFFIRWQQLKSQSITIAVIILFGFISLSLLWSVTPLSFYLSGLHKYTKLIYILFLIPLFSEIKYRERALDAFLLAMIFSALISYAKFYFPSLTGSQDASWVFHSHIETSFFMAFATYLCAHRLLKQEKIWQKLIYLLFILALSYQEFFINDGRTGWVAYFALLMLFVIQHFNWKGLAVSAILVLLLASILYHFSSTFHLGMQNVLTHIHQYHQGSTQTSEGFRLSFFKFSWDLISTHPILGIGAGSFKYAYAHSAGIAGWGPILDTPHNEYLLMAAQFGVIGLILLLYFFAIQWQISLTMRSSMRFLLQALLLSFMLSGLYNAVLYTSVTGHFYIFFLSLFLAEAFSINNSIFVENKQKLNLRQTETCVLYETN